MNDKAHHSQLIKSRARSLGFLDCGISKARVLEEEKEHLKQWLAEDRHGEMQYMENHFDKRTDPTRLVENAKSVVSVILNYYPHQQQRKDDLVTLAFVQDVSFPEFLL